MRRPDKRYLPKQTAPYALRRTLDREDQYKFAQLALIETAEWDLEKVATPNLLDPREKLRDALRKILESRMLFTT
jgi:hypothetical protein